MQIISWIFVRGLFALFLTFVVWLFGHIILGVPQVFIFKTWVQGMFFGACFADFLMWLGKEANSISNKDIRPLF